MANRLLDMGAPTTGASRPLSAVIEPDRYLTDDTHLYRVLLVSPKDGWDSVIVLEDCRSLGFLLCRTSDLDRSRLRLVGEGDRNREPRGPTTGSRIKPSLRTSV